MVALEDAERSPIAPQYLMSVIDAQAGDDAILTCDSGYYRHLGRQALDDPRRP